MERLGDSIKPRSTPAPKSSIEHLVNAINAHEDSNELEDESPRKRQRRTPPSTAPAGEAPISKKGRACMACRKLKVKCDSAEKGTEGCSRCLRLGMECVNAQRPRPGFEGDSEQQHPSLSRLERAVEDILHRMKMPSLEAYEKSALGEQNAYNRPMSELPGSRENSKEPGEGDQEVAPAPMGSLYEATKLNSLRSRSGKTSPTKRSSRRNMDMDLISRNLISVTDAEEMLVNYKTVLARYLFSTTMAEDTTLQQVRESSTMLFTSVMLVSALHIPGKEAVHRICHKYFLELIATTMFERFHTLDDIRALCIAAFWQPDLSWKLSGLAVRMATELNLHQSFYSAFYTSDLTDDQRRKALEKARVWYLLYVLDHHFSIAYGRPPVTAELTPIKMWETFMNSKWATFADRRLVSQVNLFVILSRAYECFGLEPERLMSGDDDSLRSHLKFRDDVDAWKAKWTDLVKTDKYVGDYPRKGVHLHHHFSNLVLNSLALRGRQLDPSLSTALPTNLRPIALRAIEAAHAILHFFLEEPSYRDSLVGVPLYLHSMIAFAVVFLIKISHRWHAIGITIDPEAETKPLIEGIIRVLRACKAGSGHMVYSMASGFERIMTKSWAKGQNWRRMETSQQNLQHTTQFQRTDTTGANNGNGSMRSSIDNTTSPGATYQTQYNSATQQHQQHQRHQQQQFEQASGAYGPHSNAGVPSYMREYSNPMASNANTGYGGYGLDLSDDSLWSAGMGYDLLSTNRNEFNDFSMGFDYTTGGTVTDGIAGQTIPPRHAPAG